MHYQAGCVFHWNTRLTELARTLDALFAAPAERRRVAALLPAADQLDDVLQDLAERLLKHARTPDAPKSYLREAAKNAAFNRRRASERRTTHEDNYALLNAAETVSLEHQIDAIKSIECLGKALSELPALTRTLFVQCYVLGRSQPSVARDHKLHLSTVEKQLSKAKRHCYRRLSRYLD